MSMYTRESSLDTENVELEFWAGSGSLKFTNLEYSKCIGVF